jgi:hypothetical protein
MKSIIFSTLAIVFALCSYIGNTLAQDTLIIKKKIIYSFLYNEFSDGIHIPMVGLFNLSHGSHKGLQLGLLNVNSKKESYYKGVQVGMINQVENNISGSQTGLYNSATCIHTGIQTGFINMNHSFNRGGQIGFINRSSFFNKGCQIGYVNLVKDSHKTPQFGFLNSVGKLRSFQIGFVNIADTVEAGVPIGFISIVKKGGYRAIEISANELYYFNAVFKLGIRKMYTNLVYGYNPNFVNNSAFGFGFGTITDINEKRYFSPEIFYFAPLRSGGFNSLSVVNQVGYKLSKSIDLTLGLALTWHRGESEFDLEDVPPGIATFQINSTNNLVVGPRLALRVNL